MKANSPSSLGAQAAWTTGLKFAVFAFENAPVRTGLTYATMPEDESRVALDHVERVLTEGRDGHGVLTCRDSA